MYQPKGKKGIVVTIDKGTHLKLKKLAKTLNTKNSHMLENIIIWYYKKLKGGV